MPRYISQLNTISKSGSRQGASGGLCTSRTYFYLPINYKSKTLKNTNFKKIIKRRKERQDRKKKAVEEGSSRKCSLWKRWCCLPRNNLRSKGGRKFTAQT
ncbi:hypothetical protein NPIL_140561 [Nephila pilipes]|uniref:Uncharacterized protein n=1 Tax=Nephila pilipes TaxID=299642 RepID=A0A8X6N024_NEPPI|nr:hypothetical protein NPIL_140561 [Nephila pilipes]